MQNSFAPFFTWIETGTLSYSVQSRTIYYPYFPDERWWLRNNDLIVVLVWSNSGYTISESMTTASSGAFGLHWRRWTEGDSTSLSVTLNSATAGSSARIKVFGLRGAVPTGNPFSVSHASGNGATVTFPSVKAATKETLVVNAAQLATIGGSSDVFTTVTNTSLDDLALYSQSQGSDLVLVGNVQKPGSSGQTVATSTVSGSSWDALTFGVRGVASPRKAVAGPHVSNMPASVGTKPTVPVLIPDDVVVSYRITSDGSLQPPEGWERVGTAASSGTKYLHVFWKRWAEGDSFVDDYDAFYLRHFSVVRHAAKKGDPFTASAVSTGNGTTALGSGVATSKDQLVLFATLLKQPPTSASPFGSFSSSGTSEIEIDYDSSEAVYATPGYFRALSGYATGSSAGPFIQNLNVTSTDWFAVTLAVKKA